MEKEWDKETEKRIKTHREKNGYNFTYRSKLRHKNVSMRGGRGGGHQDEAH